ncbi:MAG: TonB-dependent receptor [Sandaracinaceae bacterium]|nr:TonB-dependent receptor [Sandaracinaceae bacterium]
MSSTKAFSQGHLEAPRPIGHVHLTWPDGVEWGESVQVVVEALITAEGEAREVQVIEVRGGGEHVARFAEAAKAQVSALQFAPARRGERPIPSRARWLFTFDPPPGSAGPMELVSGKPKNKGDALGAEKPIMGEQEDASEQSPDPSRGNGMVNSVENVQKEHTSQNQFEEVNTHRFAVRAEVASERQPLVSASEQDLELGLLGRLPRRDAQSLLSLAPGLWLANHGGEGHASSFFLRGFDAKEGEALEVLLDGIPLNDRSNAHGHGYVDSSFLIPELVRGIRVIEGPFDPAQGDFAVAGTAEYRLGLEERGLLGLASYGSYGERRVAFLFGPPGTSRSTFFGVSMRGGDGWGMNRSHASASVLSQFGVRLSEEWEMQVLGVFSTANWREAGPLRLDDFQSRRLPCAPDEFSQFFCTYDGRQGGSAERVLGGLRFEWRKGSERMRFLVHASNHALRIRSNWTGFAHDPRTDGGPQRGDLLDQRTESFRVGGRFEFERRFEWIDRIHALFFGVDLRHDDVSAVQDRLRAELSVPYASDFDRAIDVTSIGGWGRLRLSWAKWFESIAGLRIDAYGFEVLDRNRPLEDRIGPRLGREATSAWGWLAQPRGTLRFRLLPDETQAALDWFLSGGLGARSSDAAALSEGELAPFAEVVSAEVGLRGRFGGNESTSRALGFGTALFSTRVTSDFVFDPAKGRNTPIGPSSRFGFLLFAHLRWEKWLELLASLSWTRAHLPPRNASVFELFAGSRLPFLPEWLARVDGSFFAPISLSPSEAVEASLALSVSWVGPRPLPFEQFADPFVLVDGALSLRWRAIEFGLVAENLFDVRYRQLEFNYVSNFVADRPPSLMPVRHFVAGPPLRILGRLVLHIDWGGV